MNLPPILLVEDNESDEFLTLRALQKAGLANEIIIVRDGQSAVDYFFGENGCLARGDGLPIVVLLDVKLPKLSGHDVLKQLRADERTSSQVVVMLTSSDEHLDIERGYQEGVNSYVKKPVDSADFQKTIAELGLYWAVTNLPTTPKP